MKSYFLQGSYLKNNTLIKALAFGGTQQTYQAWNGLEDLGKLQNDRTYNVSGEYFDDAGNLRFYDNETDNYDQNHYQLHWNQKWSDSWSTNFALHYTKGEGYFENYKQGEDLIDYGISPQMIGVKLVEKSDLIRRKWLDNDFFGTTFSANYKKDEVDFIAGGAYNRYEGKHFGNVLWTRSVILPEYNFKYYDDFSTKNDLNVFAKLNYALTEKWNLFGDLQYRNVIFTANGAETGLVNDTFNFFNPKAGVTFTANDQNNIYFSYARANREPNRNDYEGGNPRPEKLDNFELGWRYNSAKAKLTVNGYLMNYQDQLVLTGGLNDVGAPLRTNSGSSYRAGIEVDAAIYLSKKWILRPNATISSNRNRDFVFERDGVLQNLGNTNIAFSPDFIAANGLTYLPIKNMQMTFLSKFVGEQFMGNIDSERSKLSSYFVNDFNISYEIKPKSVFKSVIINGLVNNIFSHEFESNGYFYTFDDDFSNPGSITTVEGAGFYPQAGINFLAGVTLLF
jgi:iron complex outermembrane receptor protein